MRQKGQQDSQYGRNDTVPHGRRGIFVTARGKICEQTTYEAQNDDNYRNFVDFFQLVSQKHNYEIQLKPIQIKSKTRRKRK